MIAVQEGAKATTHLLVLLNWGCDCRALLASFKSPLCLPLQLLLSSGEVRVVRLDCLVAIGQSGLCKALATVAARASAACCSRTPVNAGVDWLDWRGLAGVQKAPRVLANGRRIQSSLLL